MKRVIFVGSHLGYPMDRTPLGGGAMVGVQLVRHWLERGGFGLKVLGSGPLPPVLGADYQPAGVARREDIAKLSELGYARFCRRFERATTGWIADHRDEWPPSETCVVLNDISESPDARRLAELGYPIVSIWHVDVVDFFNKMYLHNLLAPERLTRAFDRAVRVRLDWAVPGILHLVFGKQRQAVVHSGRMIVPSKRMAEILGVCYEHLKGGAGMAGRVEIVPWGGWRDPLDEARVSGAAERLKAHYQLRPETRVLMTLSRISPEKGLLLLLDALRLLESYPDRPSRDLALFVCGEPSFMRGEPYYRQVRAAAERLRSFRVFFVGYLPPLEKQVYFRLSDLFVSPSIHESYGLSIVEALQAGLPVLASDHSGVDEILSPEFSRVVHYGRKAGKIASWARRRGDIPERLAGALRDMLQDIDALRAMGARAKAASEGMSFAQAAERVAGAALMLVPDRP